MVPEVFNEMHFIALAMKCHKETNFKKWGVSKRMGGEKKCRVSKKMHCKEKNGE